jgi:hypothetical protein
MIALETYGKPNFMRRMLSHKTGWVKVYMPFGNVDLHEEEQ